MFRSISLKPSYIKLQIPKNWNVSRCGDLIDLKNGFAFKSTDFSKINGIKVVKIEQIELDGSVSLKNCQKIDSNLTTRLKNFLIQKNDILISLTGELIKIGRVVENETLLQNQRVGNCIVKNKSILNSDFLFNMLRSKIITKPILVLRSEHAQPNLGKTDFDKIFLIYPDNLPEQEKIASILSNLDKLIKKYKKILDVNTFLKRGLMQELFVKGIKHNKFKNIKWLFGKELTIPEEWHLVKLKNCVEKNSTITYGIVQAGENLKSGVPYFRTLDVTKNFMVFDNLWKTSENISNQFNRTILKENDIIITVRASVGVVKLITKEFEGCNLSRGVAKICPSEDVDTVFLLESLNSKNTQRLFSFLTNGTTFADITMANLRNLKIILPPLEEQKEIATMFSKVNSKINILNAKIMALENIQIALMQKLLTGQIRVI
jgi:type I restriction enzyme, S subunit